MSDYVWYLNYQISIVKLLAKWQVKNQVIKADHKSYSVKTKNRLILTHKKTLTLPVHNYITISSKRRSAGYRILAQMES